MCSAVGFRDSILVLKVWNQILWCLLAFWLPAVARSVEQGRWVHCYTHWNGLGLNSIVRTALIVTSMWNAGAQMMRSISFLVCRRKNAYTWTALINALAMNGHPLPFFWSYLSYVKGRSSTKWGHTFLGVLCATSVVCFLHRIGVIRSLHAESNRDLVTSIQEAGTLWLQLVNFYSICQCTENN